MQNVSWIRKLTVISNVHTILENVAGPQCKNMNFWSVSKVTGHVPALLVNTGYFTFVLL